MCAIAGIVRYAGIHAADLTALECMLRLLAHRGPDGQGLQSYSHCALGQNRLALLDLRPLTLPMKNNRGNLTLSFNGEIYNYRELKKELSSHYSFQTDSDFEVILAAYEQWGPACVKKLDGMFAFFIWDELKQVGFAARDALGVKPFFYFYDESGLGYFAFASEAAALIDSQLLAFQVNENYLLEYFTAPYFTASISTPFAGIQTLLPGETLQISRGALHRTTFFNYQFNGSESAQATDWEQLLSAAVKKQLHAHTEVGLFLSGGLDSTLLASLAPQKLKSWTLRYVGQSEQDHRQSLIVKSEDFKFAKMAATEMGHEFNPVLVDAHRYESLLPQVLARNDLISAWEQEVSQSALAAVASKKVKAVMVGDAADETHLGYSFLLREDVVKSPRHVIEFFGHVPLNRLRMPDSIAHFTEKYEHYARAQGYRWNSLSEQRLAMSKLVVDHWLRRLLHNGDTHTMTYALEARVPFTDLALIKASQNLTMRGGPEKAHLRVVAARRMSGDLAHRPKSALPKFLRAQKIIHTQFVKEWKQYSDLLSPMVDADVVDAWTKRESSTLSDRDMGLEFRILAALSWWKRFL